MSVCEIGCMVAVFAKPTSPGEIKDLLGIVDRSLADSKRRSCFDRPRFIAAFNPALCVATTALRASGLRTITQAGHHVKTIESLELTLEADSKVIQRFKTFNDKRNKSVYEVASWNGGLLAPGHKHLSFSVSRVRQCVPPHTLYFVCFVSNSLFAQLGGLVRTLLLNLPRRVHHL